MARFRKFSVQLVVAASVALVALAGGVVGWRASRALRLSSEEVRLERELRFAVRPLGTPLDVNFEAVRAPALVPSRNRAVSGKNRRTPGPG